MGNESSDYRHIRKRGQKEKAINVMKTSRTKPINMIPTPRERAQELIDYYYQFIEQDSEWAMIQNSKLCAKRVVTEVLGFLREGSHIEYWLQVNSAVDEISYIETNHPR